MAALGTCRDGSDVGCSSKGAQLVALTCRRPRTWIGCLHPHSPGSLSPAGPPRLHQNTSKPPNANPKKPLCYALCCAEATWQAGWVHACWLGHRAAEILAANSRGSAAASWCARHSTMDLPEARASPTWSTEDRLMQKGYMALISHVYRIGT